MNFHNPWQGLRIFTALGKGCEFLKPLRIFAAHVNFLRVRNFHPASDSCNSSFPDLSIPAKPHLFLPNSLNLKFCAHFCILSNPRPFTFPTPYIYTLSYSISIHFFKSSSQKISLKKNLSSHFLHPSQSPVITKTRGGHSYRPRVRPSSPLPTADPAPASATAVALAAPATATAPAPTAPVPHRYETRVGPIPPSPTHPRPSRRPPPPKRARTPGLIESSSSRPQEPHSSPTLGPTSGSPQDRSPGSIIK